MGNTRVDEFLLGSVLMDILMWVQEFSRNVSYLISVTYENEADFKTAFLRTIPETNVAWLDGLLQALPTKRIAISDLAEKDEDELGTDFDRLKTLCFSTNSNDFKHKDIKVRGEPCFCMIPSNTAY